MFVLIAIQVELSMPYRSSAQVVSDETDNISIISPYL